jgi:hypothetical protein
MAPSPYLVCGGSAISGNSKLTVNVTHSTSAGDCIAVWICSNNNNFAATPVTDSQGNTYTQAGTTALNGTNAGAWYVCQNSAHALTSGSDTITLTCTGTGGGKTLSAVGCSGVLSSGAVDQTPTPTTGTSTAPSITSGTLAQANELCLAGETNANNGGAITWTAPFTSIDAEHPGSAEYGNAATDVVSATTAVTAAGTITSAVWAMALVTLKFSVPTITTGSLPNGSTGSSYNANESESGGTAPFTWTKTAGSLPTGLNMSTAGVISGTPTVAGAFNFTVQVSDNFGFTATANQSIIITALGLAEDASTPTPTHQAMGTTGSCASNSFTPPANSLVVACFSWMFKGTGSFPGAISVSDNHGNTYLQGAEMDNTQECTTGIWIFYYTSAPGATTVTVTNTNHAAASVLLAPRVLIGAASSQAGGGSVTDNDDASMHITTTQTGSFVYCVGAAPVIKRAPTSDVTLAQLDLFQDPAGTGNQSVIGQLRNSTGVPGKTWTGWTGGLSQGCGLEILPSPAVPLGTAGHPGPTWQTGQVLGSGDVNTWILPLAQQKTAATPRSATVVLTADPDLQIPFVTAGNWAIRAVIFTDGPSAANLLCSFSIPAGATLFYQADYINSSGSTVSEAHQGSDTLVVDTTGAGTFAALIVDGLLTIFGTPGTVSFQWAQNVSNSGVTNIDQNSYLMAWRLG